MLEKQGHSFHGQKRSDSRSIFHLSPPSHGAEGSVQKAADDDGLLRGRLECELHEVELYSWATASLVASFGSSETSDSDMALRTGSIAGSIGVCRVPMNGFK